MNPLLFVYGTLRSESDSAHALFLRAGAELLGRATVCGSIFRIARYPGYFPTPAGVVIGELFRLKTPGPTLAALDSYEGGEYDRVSVEVDHGGEKKTAWIYRYRKLPAEAERIISGDYFAQ